MEIRTWIRRRAFWVGAASMVGVAAFVWAERPLAAGDGDAIGPDVIVWDLSGLEHWGGQQGKQAYSVGTVSCNIGDEPLLWVGSTNEHPVIAQNMYRLKDGRFEQIGMSWLKWAFVSVNGSACGSCINPGTGSLLGVNCSDPYGAYLNGSQSRLGPRSVVNAFTGEFPANHAHPGSGVLSGRLQVLDSDLDPAGNPGALYFVEGQYVAPDDSDAGNLHNNATHRQIWVQGGYDITFSRPGGGQSQNVRMAPGIEAWAAVDSTVQLMTIDVPDEGRLYLGWKPTHLGGALWNYEFALFNMNSDRSVGSFEVAVPDGTQLSNIGFHDVDYHSGEPYTNTDWTSTTTSIAVRWATEPYAVNPDANALRWSTVYNFRFDAEVPPAQIREVTLGLFKPGTPAALTVDLLNPYGDMNCDGFVDNEDIDPFALAITDPTLYATTWPNCNIDYADMNGDGFVDNEDIDGFIALIAVP